MTVAVQELPAFQISRFPRSPKPGAAALSGHAHPCVVPPPESADGENDVTNRENSSENFSGLNAGNFSAKNGRPRAFRVTQREWRGLSSGAFREHTKGKNKPAHVIADEVDCSPKTAQSWLDGESTPAGILDLRAMNRIPAYAALKRQIAEMETTLDPRLQAKYQELHALTLALAGRGAP